MPLASRHLERETASTIVNQQPTPRSCVNPGVLPADGGGHAGRRSRWPALGGRAVPRVHRRAGAERARAGGAQRAAARALAPAHDSTLVAEFADVASGKDDRRPDFRAALARCRQLGGVLVAAQLDDLDTSCGMKARAAAPRAVRTGAIN